MDVLRVQTDVVDINHVNNRAQNAALISSADFKLKNPEASSLEELSTKESPYAQSKDSGRASERTSTLSVTGKTSDDTLKLIHPAKASPEKPSLEQTLQSDTKNTLDKLTTGQLTHNEANSKENQSAKASDESNQAILDTLNSNSLQFKFIENKDPVSGETSKELVVFIVDSKTGEIVGQVPPPPPEYHKNGEVVQSTSFRNGHLLDTLG